MEPYVIVDEGGTNALDDEIVEDEEDGGWTIYTFKTKTTLEKNKEGVIDVVEKKLEEEALVKEMEKAKEDNDLEATNDQQDNGNFEEKTELVIQGEVLEDEIIEHEEENVLFARRVKETREYVEHSLEEKNNIGILHEQGVHLDDKIMEPEEDGGWKIHTTKKTKSKKKRGIVCKKTKRYCMQEDQEDQVVEKLREEALVEERVKAKEAEEKGLYAKMAAEILRKEEEERAKREDLKDEDDEELQRKEEHAATTKVVEQCVLEEKQFEKKRKIHNAKKAQKGEQAKKKGQAKKKARTGDHLLMSMQPCISVAVTVLVLLSGVVLSHISS